VAVGGCTYVAGALYFKEPEVGRRPSLVCTDFSLKKKIAYHAVYVSEEATFLHHILLVDDWMTTGMEGLGG